ncbi:peroxide stress protein YaaA [Thiotrichales bacterium 19S9-12]|nr:peroxide stress protein YaaA [Thiotrichales bacterium 19S9-11]MCF6811886.1 peroxide stress protein YaaA [Thiotrichales bacterium 19S9-12]
MLSLISPAKSQNFSDKAPISAYQLPRFVSEIYQLVDLLKELAPDEIASLMSISDKLASDVYGYYQNFHQSFTKENAKQAIFTFSGDVYRGLDAKTLDEGQVNFANEHVLMISGLYGLLKPLDFIQPYRLEMGSKLDIEGQSLYQFWCFKLTSYLNELLETHEIPAVINLASKEYSKAFDKKSVKGKWIDVDFKEYKNDQYKTIGIFAKRARGLMVRYIVDNKIDHPDKLMNFDIEGYQYNDVLSKPSHLIFTR